MKSLRNSPLALATAALVAAPSAGAQPMQITPPASEPAQAEPRAPSGPSAIAPVPQELTPRTAPSADEAPAPARQAQTQTAPPAPPPSPPAPPPRMASTPSATVSVGEQTDYTRLSFNFAGATSVTTALNGDRLELRFSRAADLDLAEIRAAPPRLLREARRASAAGAPVRVVLTVDAGVRERHFTDGNRVVIDLLPPTPETGGLAVTENGVTAPAPALASISGDARVRLVEEANATRITVSWPGPARAAAFRRGEAIWLLFDATGRVDLAGVARAGRRHRDIEVVRGEGVVGLRIPAPSDMQVSATASGNDWIFSLGARADAGAAASLVRDLRADGSARLVAQFSRPGAVRWINDPEIGDRIAVALIGGPAKGIDVRRAAIEAAILPAAHGAVIEPRADGVTAAFSNGSLIVSRGDDGLLASAPPTAAAVELNAALLEAAVNPHGEEAHAPAVSAAEVNLVQVRERIDELTRQAAMEGSEPGAPVTGRIELARLLLEHEFAVEALGALRMAALNQPELPETDAEYRLMRGAANIMMGRVSAALADLNASVLQDNPSAALWRGYAAAEQQEWSDARRELERGIGALEEHQPIWRARFQLALAHAALELNDLPAADAAASAALGQSPDAHVRGAAQLVQAQIAAARGDQERAFAMLEQLSGVPEEEVAVSANVQAIRLRRLSGQLAAEDAIEPLEALRYRWRGDSSELAVVGMLGDVYSELGRWRDALATMRIASDRFPTNPASRQLRVDMSNLFERLFLDGEADQLEPIQALALFYEFSDITPVGPNGDRIVRLLAGRLVNVDLLEQASLLLQHQVDERLEGVSKANVAADLALIYLMDRKPDRALVALATSRQPNMPANLLADRRILEARALLELGRLEAAVELVERDRSEDAQRVRAEAAWRARDWERASAELRNFLSLRDRAQPLDADARQAVLRAGVAMTLAGNESGVRQLYRDYAGDMANTDEADGFEVIASGVNADGVAIRDVARAVARTDLLDRFMQRMRTHLTEEAAQASNAQETPPRPQAAAPATPTG